jgi:hypothetical protein
MKGLLSLLILLNVFCSGCCTRSRIDAPYPTNVELGWKSNDKGGSYGRFVLKKGEFTDISGIRIEVVNIVPSSNCINSPEYMPPYGLLKFTRLSDKKNLCEVIAQEGRSGHLRGCEGELYKLGIEYYGVEGINLKEGWIDFVIKQ